MISFFFYLFEKCIKKLNYESYNIESVHYSLFSSANAKIDLRYECLGSYHYI